MRITLVSFLWDRLGGAVSIPQRLAGRYAELGHEVTVITSHRQRRMVVEKENGVTVYRFRPANLYWVGDKDDRAPFARAIWQLVDTWNPAVYRVATRLLRDVRPDVVHIQKLRGLSPSVWQAARRAGVPAVVQTCQDYELISPIGTLEGRIGAWARRRHILLRPYQSVRARASRAVDVVTACSQYVLDAVRAQGMFPHAEACAVPNFHDVSDERIESFGLTRRESRGAVRLLFLGRLEVSKGIGLLVNALRRVPDPFQLIVAGWGGAKSDIERAAQQDDRIQLVGTVEGEERDRLLSTADVLIVPSIWEEPFGMVVVEALARGTPVIASRAGALPSLVQEGVTGWLFDAGDESALAGVVRRAVRGRRELAAMRSACLEAAREYTLERVMERYLALYDRALNARHVTARDRSRADDERNH